MFESNDLTIRSCWIRQGSRNTFTGEWQLIRYTASCLRHFALQEWIPLKKLPQVLPSFASNKLLFRFHFSMYCLYYRILNAGDVKELYEKMLDSVKVKRSMPPNAWLWSMISNCKHQHDIRLLFDILQNLRIFVSFYSFFFSINYCNCYLWWWILI